MAWSRAQNAALFFKLFRPKRIDIEARRQCLRQRSAAVIALRRPYQTSLLEKDGVRGTAADINDHGRRRIAAQYSGQPEAFDFERAKALLERNKASIGYQTLHGAMDVVKVSAIGVGMRSHAGVAAKAFRALADKGVNIRAITTSEIKFSVLIDAEYTELAVRTLHTLYGLDKA